jgi:hypothetical protein
LWGIYFLLFFFNLRTLVTFFLLFFCRNRLVDSWIVSISGRSYLCFCFFNLKMLVTFFFLFFCRNRLVDSWIVSISGGNYFVLFFNLRTYTNVLFHFRRKSRNWIADYYAQFNSKIRNLSFFYFFLGPFVKSLQGFG